jgi:hypothetical protein
MSTTDTSPIVHGDGWAIQRAGSFVLGVWNAPMTEERIEACRRLYREAKLRHGRLAVLAVFRTNPFPLELVANEGARSSIVRLLDEFGESFDGVISVVDAKGFQASMIRMAAAAVTRLVGRGVPLFFPSTLDEGIAKAHERDAFHGVDEASVRRLLAELDTLLGHDAAG